MKENISHYDLCRLTAERYFKTLRADVALWEYKTMTCSEEPDVLIFKSAFTSLYEIKVSRSDFLADKKKSCRVKYRVMNYNLRTVKINDDRVNIRTHSVYGGSLECFYQEEPHLGTRRYFVCPSGMIDPKEAPQNWGLIWFKNGRFSVKKKSGKHRKNIHAEMNLLTHAFRKKTGPDSCNVIVNSFNKRDFT